MSPPILLGRSETLLEIGEDVVDSLDTHGEAHQAGRDTRLELLLRGELAVRRRRRVDDQRAYVADVGDVTVQRQRIDEPLARVDAAGDLEADDGALSARCELLSALVPG